MYPSESGGLSARDVKPCVVNDRYEIREFVASGSMGAVYKGIDRDLGRVVAAKLLNGSGQGNSKDVAAREARVLAAINHPNTLSVYDIIEEDERAWIICEWLEGASLGRVRQPLPPLQVTAIMVQLFEALVATHKAQVYHRDIKPENLFITNEGRLILIDFGVAFTPNNSTGETMAGSLRYLDSRILEGEPADAYSDMFSAMLVMLELLTGKPMLPDLAPLPLYRYMKHDFPLDFDELVEGAYPPLISLARRFTVEEGRGRDGEQHKDPARFVARVLQEIHRTHTKLTPAHYLHEYHPFTAATDEKGVASTLGEANESIQSNQVSPHEKSLWLAFHRHQTEASADGGSKQRPKKNQASAPVSTLRRHMETVRNAALAIATLFVFWAVWNQGAPNLQADSQRLAELARLMDNRQDYGGAITGSSEPLPSDQLSPAKTDIETTQQRSLATSGRATVPAQAANAEQVAVYIATNAWVDVTIDGQAMGRLPSAKPFLLARGRHSLLLSSPYVDPLETEIDITYSDDKAKFHFVLQKRMAQRTLKVSEPGQITIEDRTYQVLDSLELALPFGHIDVAISIPGNAEQVIALTLDDESPTVIQLY